jgi:hypothetical protein
MMQKKFYKIFDKDVKTFLKNIKKELVEKKFLPKKNKLLTSNLMKQLYQ